MEAVLRTEVEVQGAELDLLDNDTAVGMHDGLGQPRGARGIHDPERMVEGHMLHLQRRIACDRGVPAGAIGESGGVGRRVEAG